MPRKKSQPNDGSGSSESIPALVNDGLELESVSDSGIRLDQSFVAAQCLVLQAWPEMVKKLISLAKAGDVDAFRELRMSVVEPMFAQKGKDAPKESDKVTQALGWLTAGEEIPTEEMPLG